MLRCRGALSRLYTRQSHDFIPDCRFKGSLDRWHTLGHRTGAQNNGAEITGKTKDESMSSAGLLYGNPMGYKDRSC